MSKLNSSSSELDLDRPNIEDYLPNGSIQEPHGKLRLRDLLDISPTLTEAAGAIVDDSFTRCFKSTPPEPWNWNVYLFLLWCLGVGVRYLILFPLRVPAGISRNLDKYLGTVGTTTVSSALYCLRQWNTYQGSSPFARPRTTANLGDSSGPLSSFDQPANHLQKSGPDVHDIVESSKTKAWTMVDAAMQAITSLKAGGNTFERIEDAIDYVSNRLSFDDSCLLAMRHTAADAFHGSSSSHYLLTSCCPSNSLHSTGPDLKNVLDRNEAQIPSELISHSVGTFLPNQKCTKREFPPADVAMILDSAVTSLQPCCSHNLPVSAEIQKCMGIIKNQILALVPT